jgi:hypothetical protein
VHYRRVTNLRHDDFRTEVSESDLGILAEATGLGPALPAVTVRRKVGNYRKQVAGMYSFGAARSDRETIIEPISNPGPLNCRIYSDGGAASVHGEFRAVNEAGAVCRQEDNCFSNFIGCCRTTRGRLGG